MAVASKGLPTVIFVGGVVLVSGLALTLVIHASLQMRRRWIRVIIVVGHVVAGYLFYAITTLWYVLSTGVDSL